MPDSPTLPGLAPNAMPARATRRGFEGAFYVAGTGYGKTRRVLSDATRASEDGCAVIVFDPSKRIQPGELAFDGNPADMVGGDATVIHEPLTIERLAVDAMPSCKTVIVCDELSLHHLPPANSAAARPWSDAFQLHRGGPGRPQFAFVGASTRALHLTPYLTQAVHHTFVGDGLKPTEYRYLHLRSSAVKLPPPPPCGWPKWMWHLESGTAVCPPSDYDSALFTVDHAEW